MQPPDRGTESREPRELGEPSQAEAWPGQSPELSVCDRDTERPTGGDSGAKSGWVGSECHGCIGFVWSRPQGEGALTIIVCLDRK